MGMRDARVVGDRGERKAAVARGHVFQIKMRFRFPRGTRTARTRRRITTRAMRCSAALTTRAPGLMMPAFSPGDFLDRMAQIIFVIEIDLRDDGDFRQQNIRRIQAPAHAGFANGKFRGAPAKNEGGAVTHSKNVGCAASFPAASNSSIAPRTRVNVAANPRRKFPGRPGECAR
jgi:hypothetical protein